jgi:shikimate dehydrogenase
VTTARTRTVVLLGHPVDHSRSPQIHTAAFAATDVDAVYVTADVPPDQLPAAVAGIRALGLLGANVTIPHKQALPVLVDRLTAEAELVGAVNTLFWDDGALVGDNTDATGLVGVLRDDVGLAAGDVVEIFGAGGVARAAAVAAGRLGARMKVTARRPDAAAEVAALAARAGAQAAGGEPARVIVNATPLGMHGEPLPDVYLELDPGQTALDLVYGADTTPFVAAARARGVPAFDGLGLLVAQAAGSFTRWTQRAAPVAAMRAAVSDRAR